MFVTTCFDLTFLVKKQFAPLASQRGRACMPRSRVSDKPRYFWMYDLPFEQSFERTCGVTCRIRDNISRARKAKISCGVTEGKVKRSGRAGNLALAHVEPV